jgi:hypothetical protein
VALKYASETRRGIYIGGMLRAVHKARIICIAGPRRKLITDDWSKVTCKDCLKRRTKKKRGRGPNRNKALPKGVRRVR